MCQLLCSNVKPEKFNIVISDPVSSRSMSEKKLPVIADTKPVVFEIEPGTYHWCSCGLSKNQPYCDGSHKGTDMGPLKFEISKKRRVALCTCKHTQNAPFCDGKHKDL